MNNDNLRKAFQHELNSLYVRMNWELNDTPNIAEAIKRIKEAIELLDKEAR